MASGARVATIARPYDGAMDSQPTMPPPPSSVDRCYRHPDVQTGVHCTRCGRPICPDCMRVAPVGHHCPTCVEEARKEFRQGPGRRIAIANAKAVSITSALLVAIAAVYVLEVIRGGAGALFNGPNTVVLVKMGASVGLFPVTNTEIVGIALGQTWRLVSSMFLHAGLLHLLFNMYALWIFGTVMEDELGRGRYALVYFLTGLAAGAASYAFMPEVYIPGVGASGAVFGVFGALVAFNWKRRHTALGAARLRSAIFILLINAFLGFSSGGAIDWRAHAGGFVAGLLMGFAAEGFGRYRNERLTFAIGSLAVLAVTVGLVVWRTAEIKLQYPGVF
jgi:membrane associated rhomboid family serine protease